MWRRCFGCRVLVVAILLVGTVTSAQQTSEEPGRASIAIQALSRLKGANLEENPSIKAAVLRVLETVRGRPEFVEIVRDFKLSGHEEGLLEIAIRDPHTSTGVEAMRLVLDSGDNTALRESLQSPHAPAVIRALGNTAESRVLDWVEPIVLESGRDPSTRKQAVQAMAQTREGAGRLLELAREEKLPADLRFAAGTALSGVRWPDILSDAMTVFPMPKGRDDDPLPPVSELLSHVGDADRGRKVFESEIVGCSRCHRVRGEGVDFGPDLSEIGAKLGKDALYEAILAPSAGVSFGYEGWEIELASGDEAFGIILSETPDEVQVKGQTGIVSRHRKSDIVHRRMQSLSIMPSGLEATMSAQDLVDLVEYLASLTAPAIGSEPAMR